MTYRHRFDEIRKWTERQRRTQREYATTPQTHGNNIAGPCIRDCGRTAYTQRGVCRACLQSEGDK